MEAFFWLSLFRLLIRLLPFRRFAHLAGEQGKQADPVLSESQRSRAILIGWAVAAASRHTLYPSTCLMQAMSGMRMLRRRHIPATLYFGVNSAAGSGLQAHAWLVCGTVVLTGAEGRSDYRVVSTYA